MREYDSVAEQVASALRKYLPDLGKSGGLQTFTVHIRVPPGGGIFPNPQTRLGCYQLIVNIEPDAD